MSSGFYSKEELLERRVANLEKWIEHYKYNMERYKKLLLEAQEAIEVLEHEVGFNNLDDLDDGRCSRG